MLKGPARLEGPFSMEIKIEAIADANPHKNKTGAGSVLSLVVAVKSSENLSWQHQFFLFGEACLVQSKILRIFICHKVA